MFKFYFRISLGHLILSLLAHHYFQKPPPVTSLTIEKPRPKVEDMQVGQGELLAPKGH